MSIERCVVGKGSDDYKNKPRKCETRNASHENATARSLEMHPRLDETTLRARVRNRLIRCARPCIEADGTSSRFLARPTSRIACCARWRRRPSIIAAPTFAALGREVLDGLKKVFRTTGPVVIFPASGSGAWEAALVNTLSPGDKVLAFENGEFARLVGGSGAAARPGGRGGPVRLAPRRRSGRRRNEAEGRSRHSRRAGRAQRDLHRRHQPAAGHPQGHRRRQHPMPCCSSTRSRRWPSIDLRHDDWRHRRHAVGVAEGADAAAWPQLQRDQREGARGVTRRAPGAVVLVVAADARLQPERLFPLHAVDEPALRPARGAEDAGRRGPSERLRAALPAGRSGSRGGRAPGASRSRASGPTNTAPL